MEQTIRKEQDEKVSLLFWSLHSSCVMSASSTGRSHSHEGAVCTTGQSKGHTLQAGGYRQCRTRPGTIIWSHDPGYSQLLQLQERVVVLQGEKDALEEQLRIEKAGNRGLETLLASERKKVFV